jgi:hypothetical protein
MKGKDYGSNNSPTKEKENVSISPKEIEAQLEHINQNLINNNLILKNVEDGQRIQLASPNKDKFQQSNETIFAEENKNTPSDLSSKISNNNKNNCLKNENNNTNAKNCINNIDLEKNIIVINKQNLKEFNNIIKEIKNEKKNEINNNKKGEAINLFVTENINHNSELSNSIKFSFGHLLDDFSDKNDNLGQIKSNSEFPNEIIERFFQKKRNKYKEKNINNFNYISSFGNNPLEKIKDIQNNIIEPSKVTSKQIKINQKNLKEQNILLQKYIKALPVFNCPESKIFKSNKNYFFNKINYDKTMLNGNNRHNKNTKNTTILNCNSSHNREEGEEETIERHIKKKFINKKRNKS